MSGRGLILACWLSISALASPITYQGAGGGIPDDGPGVFSSVISVPDSGFIAGGLNNVTVRLINLQHTAVSDLTVTLTQESVGVSRTLFDQVGLPDDAPTADLDDVYTFASGNTGDFWTTALLLIDTQVVPGDLAGTPASYYPINAGSNAPNDFSAAFAGISPTGNWRLTITDVPAFDFGTLESWELILDIEATQVPEPSSTFLVLGGACLLAIRRFLA
ncbi:MAG: proprotein convertase P-domain-containing protein [Bryobacteraceae bacterium]